MDSGAASRGVALVAVLVVMAFVSAVGLGLLLITSIEPLAEANHESALLARYAAEAGLDVAAHELGERSDWDAVLTGVAASGLLDPAGGMIGLPDGTTVEAAALTNGATCGHPEPCTERELTAFVADRPWGPNNPRWTLFGVLHMARVAPEAPPSLAVVWMADDPADIDGNAWRDTVPAADGSRGPGACIVAVRVEGFASRAGHRTIVATLARADPECRQGARVVSWREVF
ncbi:MAG: hypothetical protein NTY02_17625 [Acidobacteria bacterium]|nr:hypothetical protein [Acidobacteriota bacterium]